MIVFFLILMSANSLGQNKRLTFWASQVVVSVISSSVFNLGMDVWAHLDIVYMWSWIFINKFKVEQWGRGSEENSTASDPWCLCFFSCSHLHFFLSVSLFLSRSSRPVYFQHLSERIDIKTLTQMLLGNSLYTMPKPVYVSIIYRVLAVCGSVNLFSHYPHSVAWPSMRVPGQTLPHEHTHTHTQSSVSCFICSQHDTHRGRCRAGGGGC